MNLLTKLKTGVPLIGRMLVIPSGKKIRKPGVMRQIKLLKKLVIR
jgi:hypothetical protein